MTAPRRWRSVDPALHWYERLGESEVLAFSPRSGSVHLLSASARPLLDDLTSSSLTLEEISSRLELDTDSAMAVVLSLDEAGLIEPAP